MTNFDVYHTGKMLTLIYKLTDNQGSIIDHKATQRTLGDYLKTAQTSLQQKKVETRESKRAATVSSFKESSKSSDFKQCTFAKSKGMIRESAYNLGQLSEKHSSPVMPSKQIFADQKSSPDKIHYKSSPSLHQTQYSTHENNLSQNKASLSP